MRGEISSHAGDVKATLEVNGQLFECQVQTESFRYSGARALVAYLVENFAERAGIELPGDLPEKLLSQGDYTFVFNGGGTDAR